MLQIIRELERGSHGGMKNIAYGNMKLHNYLLESSYLVDHNVDGSTILKKVRKKSGCHDVGSIKLDKGTGRYRFVCTSSFCLSMYLQIERYR